MLHHAAIVDHVHAAAASFNHGMYGNHRSPHHRGIAPSRAMAAT
jgi:hypothetical protein